MRVYTRTMSNACYCIVLRKASRRISAVYDEALAPYGINIAQFSAMRNIIRRSHFQSLNAFQESMGDRLFANPRNAASGSLRQKTEGKNERQLEAMRQRLSRLRMTVHGIGAWPDPPVAAQSQVYELLASWGLRLQGIPVIFFACRAGMSRCVLGTDREHPEKAPPCRSCIYQSSTLYW